jgi:glutathione synthase/RimK-type ligase-like ATP-grasp enzyme
MLYILHGGYLMDRMPVEFAVYDRFRNQGAAVAFLNWKDLKVDALSSADTVVFRLVWGYDSDVRRFLSFIDAVAASGAAMVPRHETLRWNVHKKYLAELQSAGVSMPWCRYHASDGFPLELLDARKTYVLKPAVSAGARGIIKTSGEALHKHEISIPDDVLVQEFVPSVEAGERSQLFFNGVFSHAVLKIPAQGDFRVQKVYGGRVEDYQPSEEERSWALSVLEKTPVPVDYARVDYLMHNGVPQLMELELIEPELFLSKPEHQNRFAETVARWMH